MESENGKIYFGVGLNNDELLQDAEKCKQLLAGIGTEAVKQGDVLDRAFGSAGAAKGLTNLEAEIKGASNALGGLDFSSAQDRISSLSQIIGDNENILASLTKQLDEYKAQAEAAFKSGDTAAFDKANASIQTQIQRIQELTDETTAYKGVLAAVMSESGMGGTSGSAPMLFNSEADINALEDLKTKIAEVKAEIAQTAQSGGDTSALTQQLSSMNDELNATELAAAQAAAALGSDLGGRAIEAQQSLHQLNQAVAEQQSIIDALTPALEAAKAEYESLANTEGASADEVSRAAATYDTLSASMANAQAQMAGLQSAQQAAQGQWNNINQEMNAQDSIMAKMLGGYENMQGIMDKLPAGLQGAVKGLQGMTGAAKAFIATPLGAILAALILAYQAVKTALNSTVDGQLKLAQMSGYLSGVLGQLKEIVIKVGQFIVKAFTDPKQALKDFANAIKEQVVNRLKAVVDMAGSMGRILKSAFTLDWDGLKDALADYGESMAQFVTGIDDLPGKVAKFAESVNDAGKEQADINKQTKELEIEVSKWGAINQELEKKKAEARGRMSNTSLSAAERKKAEKEYRDAVEQQYNTEKKFADKRIELQKRTMALTSNTIEDENRLRDLETQRAALETQRAQQMAMLERRSGSITNTAMREANSENTAEQKRLQAQKNIADMEADLIISNNRRKVALMQEGHERTLAELDLERQEQLQKLQELQDKLKKQNEAAGTSGLNAQGLTDTQANEIKKAEEGINATYAKGVKDSLQAELESVMTYEQKKLKVREEYQKKLDSMYETDSEGNKSLRAGFTQGNVDELERQSNEALNAVDEQFASRSETYQAWCNEVASMTLEQLEQALKEAEKELTQAQANGASGEELAVAQAKVNKADQAVKKQKAQRDALSPGKRSIKEWKDLYDTLNDCVDAFDAVGDALGGTVGDIISTAGTIASKAISMVNSIMQVTNAAIGGMKGGAEGAAESIKAVERASVILTIISIALEITMKIINAVNNAINEKHVKRIEELQSSVDILDNQYEKLGKQIDKAYSKDASKLIEQQNTLLQQQRTLVNEMMAEEEAKKKTDQDTIESYRDKLQEISDQIEENKEKAIDAIFGEDLQSAIENFASAYADAWTEGESRSAAVKDTVKKMMQQMVTESIKAAIQAGGQMDAIREKLRQFYADGVLTDWEQKYVLNMAEKIEDELNERYAWANKLMSSDDDERSGSSAGITTASQDTVDELNGRATAIQSHTFSINENTQSILRTTNAILNSVLNIEDHTDEIRDRVGNLEVGMRDVRDTLSDISIKGIRIK